MQSFNRSVWSFVGALAAVGAVHAQVPLGNDTTDVNGNTGMGSFALGGPANSNGGYNNTATGIYALYANGSGKDNTATGAYALNLNTWGGENTALGAAALQRNTSGGYNTATGTFALTSNTTGFGNTASGDGALYSNTTGELNIASGLGALARNTEGGYNVAIGFSALGSNTSGSANISVGNQSGASLTTGSNNIDIGNLGLAADNGIIRLGTAGTHKSAYIAGIENARVTGAAVYVTAAGQLGVLASSERYKTAIAPLGAGTDRLARLRPVSFHLKSDPTGVVQYGLIAEEVEKVYPELVIRDSAGTIQGVRYDELAPLLLNEIQRQRRQVTIAAEKAASQERIVQSQAGQLAEVNARVSELNRQMAEVRQLNESLLAAVSLLQANADRVAMR